MGCSPWGRKESDATERRHRLAGSPPSALSLQGELLSPCRCAGSVKCTHQPCLIKWISERGCWSCELCYYKYHVIAISTKNPLQVRPRAARAFPRPLSSGAVEEGKETGRVGETEDGERAGGQGRTFLCFLLSLSQKRREGWDQETEIEKGTWGIRWKRENSGFMHK